MDQKTFKFRNVYFNDMYVINYFYKLTVKICILFKQTTAGSLNDWILIAFDIFCELNF